MLPQMAYARDHQSATGSRVDSQCMHCDQACSVMCKQLSGVRGPGSGLVLLQAARHLSNSNPELKSSQPSGQSRDADQNLARLSIGTPDDWLCLSVLGMFEGMSWSRPGLYHDNVTDDAPAQLLCSVVFKQVYLLSAGWMSTRWVAS